MKRKLHQLVAGYTQGDAISNEARALRRLFRSWGYDSEIYCGIQQTMQELRGDAKDTTGLSESLTDQDVTILHLSIGSPVNDQFASLPGKKAIIYHNITPPNFFAGVQEQTARHLARGREQATRLAGVADIVLADTQFNADDLTNMGHRNVQVMPLMLDLDRVRSAPSKRVLSDYDDDTTTVLFVGRSTPNKRIEDVLHAFYYFQQFVEPNSRFIHVGSHGGTEIYHAMLLTIASELELDSVYFTGKVTDAELTAYYRCADLFLCMSEHEGFCIPLLESMSHGVPTLAYAAAAVPETMDGAGVLFAEKDFALVAEAMGMACRPGPTREALLKGQQARLERYNTRDLEAELRNHLGPLLH